MSQIRGPSPSNGSPQATSLDKPLGNMAQPSSARIGIIGAGAAGLITAHTLLRDGFVSVEVLTRDESAGGVWAAERVYPGLSINKLVAS